MRISIHGWYFSEERLKREKKVANIKQVAELAGLSVSCISKYLKDKNSVLPNNRKKIEAAIASLEYVPSQTARSLRVGKTFLIAVIVPSLADPFYLTLFESLRLCLDKLSYGVTLQIIPQSGAFSAESFLSVDGAVICSFDNEEAIVRAYSVLAKLSKPLVCVHWRPASAIDESLAGKVSTAICNVRGGVQKAVRHLDLTGRKQIAYVGGPENNVFSEQMAAGFFSQIDSDKSFGVFRGDFAFETGVTSVNSMLAGSDFPDAIMCESDIIAAGVIRQLITIGAKVPEHTAVIGFGNTMLGSMYSPSITSVDIPADTVAEYSVKTLMEALSGKAAADLEFLCELELRKSSRKL